MMNKTLTAIFLFLLAGCAEPQGELPEIAPEEPPVHDDAPSAHDMEPQRLPDPPPFDEEWTFQADVRGNYTIEFEATADMTLNFTGTIERYAGTYLSIEIPMDCGDLSPNEASTGTALITGNTLGTIPCFVTKGTHAIHIQADGTAQGTIHAFNNA